MPSFPSVLATWWQCPKKLHWLFYQKNLVPPTLSHPLGLTSDSRHDCSGQFSTGFNSCRNDRVLLQENVFVFCWGASPMPLPGTLGVPVAHTPSSQKWVAKTSSGAPSTKVDDSSGVNAAPWLSAGPRSQEALHKPLRRPPQAHPGA